MRIVYSLVAVAVAVAVAIAIIAALPTAFLPKRWHDIHPGQHRPAVIAVLGIPDADYFNAKSFDGWFNPFGVGASTMTVNYAQDSDVVRDVEIKTAWGFAYRTWARGYDRELSVDQPKP